ncbi:MAG: DUF2207 domain-containing protein, partial [Pseudomonadota bacterium]
AYAGVAQADERILSYEINLQVEDDGAFLVTERILVEAEGFEIRRGIFRDFPTVRRAESGLVEKTTFEVLDVTRDGAPEDYFTEPIEGGTRLFIGNEGIFLSPGRYNYAITYRTRNQMGYFPSFDEVYWNATGNFWSFAIERAVATIILPEGAQVGNTAAFTGSFGSTEQAATIEIVGPRTVRFETTRTLKPREGLTVAVGFQKGLVPEPSPNQLFLQSLWHNAGIAAVIIGFVAVFLYMLTTWFRVGRDPERGVIIPRFEPPRGLSPAALSWVWYRGHKGGNAGKSFMAALVSLGAKGVINIEEADKKITVRRRTDNQPGALPPGEAALLQKLFYGSEAITFNRSNSSRLIKATTGFSKAVTGEHKGRYFKWNTGYAIIAVVIAVVALFAFLATFPATDDIAIGMIFHFLGGLGVGFAATTAYAKYTGRAPHVSGFGAVAYTVASLGVVAFLYFLFHQVSFTGTGVFVTGWAIQLTMIAAFLMGFTITSLGKLLFAPTPEGQALMDEIEGFRLYLSVAEKDRLNMIDAPDFSLELFERFLPYAIALGV